MLGQKIKMRKNILLVIFLGAVLGINIYFRLFTIYFPKLKDVSRNTVEQKTREDIVKDIDNKYPGFNQLAKNRLIEKSLQEYKKNNAPDIKNRIQQEYRTLKDKYQDETGQTYLLELDCWHWARYTENVYRFGHPGDKVVNGKQMDTLMFAPSGSILPWSQFLFYLSARLYKAFSFIYKPIPIYHFLFYLPLFFVTIFLIALYLFCFYHWGNLAAVMACLFIGLSPIFLLRSCAGWFDTDILNLLFPLLIVWMYLKAYTAVSLRARLIYLCFSAFWLGLFSYTWINWWFIFLVILIYETYSFATSLLLPHFRKYEGLPSLNKRFFTLGLFLIFSFFWVILFSGPEPLRILYAQIKQAASLNSPLVFSVWPNVFSTVAELEKSNLINIGSLTGDLPTFAGAFACLIMLFFRTLHNRERLVFKRECAIILFFWFLSMFFACFKGARFTMFILIPLGVALGWILDEAYNYFKKINIWATVIVGIFVAFFCVQFTNNAKKSMRNVFPLMTDTWYKTLAKINRQTPDNAVINSWWDFGDWFKAVARRKVIFDGQSQNTPQAYWMANVLITGNEEQAVRILSMLNNGGNKAFEIINQNLKNPIASRLLLEKILLVEEAKAKDILLRTLPPADTEKVLALVFGKPGNAYLVVDYDMLRIIKSTSFLGNWDPIKVYLSQGAGKRKAAQTLDYFINLGYNKQQLDKYYQEASILSGQDFNKWVSHVLKFNSPVLKGDEKDGIVLFDRGLVYNPKEKTVYCYSADDSSYKIPKSLFLFNQDKFEENAYEKNDYDFSVLIFKDKEDYRAILLSPELAKSMFVRLYFLNGAGLGHFKPFITQEDKDDENTDYIRVFEINWSVK